jgi:Flp pilus assembly pilin Flp
MPYRLFGALHAAALSTLATLSARSRDERGQGTVEYVALILLLALVFAAVVKFGAGKDFDIGKTIVGKLKDAIDGVGDPPK